MKFSMSMSFINHADQEITVTDAEDGGAQIESVDIGDKTQFKTRVFLDAEEIDRMIDMLKQMKQHIE